LTDDEPKQTQAPSAIYMSRRRRRPEPMVVVLVVLCVAAAVLAVFAVVLWFTGA